MNKLSKPDLLSPAADAEGTVDDKLHAALRESEEAVSQLYMREDDPLLDGMLLLCRFYERSVSGTELTAGLPLDADGRINLSLLERVGARADLRVTVREGQPIGKIAQALLPALVVMKDGAVLALVAHEDNECLLVAPQLDAKPFPLPTEELEKNHSGVVVFCAPMPRRDSRVGAFAADPKGHWFWSEVAKYKWQFAEIALAAAIANIFAICVSIYSRQVFDRVIPNQSFSTLWVLVVGVLLAIGFEAITRIIRAYLIDIAGKKLDLTLSSRIFEQALGMRLDVRPKSTGSFVNQVRESDTVREFFTSTTIAAISDLPFVFLFIAVIWMIAGPMAWVQIMAIPLIVIPGLLAQWPLSRYSRQHLRESSLRNGLLIEAMSGAETLKTLGAESRFQRLWEECTTLLSGNSTKMRSVTNTLSYLASAVQHVAYVMLLVVGVYLISNGQLTTGGLLACSILSSRAISPLTQLAGILGRWQTTRTALTGLEAIMSTPVDRPRNGQFVHRPSLRGAYSLENASFNYERDGEAALQIPSLSFEPGSATALLGTNGSGKSTLLKILAGLYPISGGNLVMDGTDIRQIDPADLHKNIAYLPQDIRLFYGSLRENLLLGLGRRSDEELLEALAFVGAESLVREHPRGLDRPIGEGGSGVSGGQRQSIGLARIWLRDPKVVLLDEPTSAMDHALELKVIANLQQWLKGRTLVVATHRQPVLQLVQQATVLVRGRPAVSGLLDEVMAVLSGNEKNAKGRGKNEPA